MGNKFENLANQFGQSERYSIVVPQSIVKVLTELVKTPYALYDLFTQALKEPQLMYSYVLTKK